MRTRSQAAAAVLTLTSLPDDAFHQVIMALCIPDTWGPPLFEAVKELAYLSKGVLQQLHRLRPLVGVTSRAIVERPAHGPWRAVLTVHTDFSPSTKRRPRGTSPSEDEQAQFKKQCKMP